MIDRAPRIYEQLQAQDIGADGHPGRTSHLKWYDMTLDEIFLRLIGYIPSRRFLEASAAKPGGTTTGKINWAELGRSFALATGDEQASFLENAATQLRHLPGVPDTQLLAIAEALGENTRPENLSIVEDFLGTIQQHLARRPHA